MNTDKILGGESLPLDPAATASSATPSNGGHPRNAPDKFNFHYFLFTDIVSFIAPVL